MNRSTLYAKSLVAAWAETKAHDHKALLGRFVEQLQHDHVMSLLPEIITAVEKELADRARHEQTVLEVATNHKPTKHLRDQFAEAVVEEADLLGGFRVRRQHEIIDASLAGALSHIRQSLTNA